MFLSPLNSVFFERHYKIARGTQELLQRYRELQDIIAILGMEECPIICDISFYLLLFDNLPFLY